MCAGAAVLARVARVVFAAYDEKAGAVGSLWDVVRDRRLNHRPEVVAGVLGGRVDRPARRLLRRSSAARPATHGLAPGRPDFRPAPPLR